MKTVNLKHVASLILVVVSVITLVVTPSISVVIRGTIALGGEYLLWVFPLMLSIYLGRTR